MSLLEPYELFYRHRRLFWSSIKATLKLRYAGSIIGRGWIVVGPLILLSLYALIYTVVFRFQPPAMDLLDYILYIFAGLVPFIAVAQSLGAGAASLSNDQQLLLNKVFPAELIPVREVVAAGSVLLVGVVVTIIFKLATGTVYWTWLLLPVALLTTAMATSGVVWGLSLLNLIIKDTSQMITYLILLLLIASPISYTPDMLPDSLKLLLYCNPLAYYVTSFQSLLVLGKLPPVPIMIGTIVFAFVSFHGMYEIFRNAKKLVFDLL